MEKQRYTYDLGHYQFQCGKIGSLQTLGFIPIVAGDSISLGGAGIWRLSALRRNLTMDARCEIFGFWVPYRHIYGDDWIDFLKQGQDETITFGTVNLGSDFHSYLGFPMNNTVPTWLVDGYINIWNRYFRVPTEDSAILPNGSDPTSNENERFYGLTCGHLPAAWNTGIDGEVDSSDLEVSTAGDVLDLTDLAKQRMRLRTERRREYFSQRYNDVLARTFGTNVNIDADERPELLFRNSFWMSGYDVDGTGDASLGTYSGKAAVVGQYGMRRRRFNEHGTLWLMCLVRFPPVHEREIHWLVQNPNPNYVEFTGDPDLYAVQPPETLDLDDWFSAHGGGVTFVADAGLAPFGQHYRWHPNHVHRKYDGLNGFAFLSGSIGTKEKARYIDSAAYDNVFDTTQLGHWQCQVRVEVDASRVIPPAESSIFAGS